jgi:L-rhamnonate dehydratase
MKIKSIHAAAIDLTPRPKTAPRVARQAVGGFVSPLERYPDLPRSSWSAPWKRTACVVTAEDGTWGLGITIHGGPVERIINDHFAPVLAGQNCLATEKLWDTMQRISAPYGTAGLASYAISAVDLALWDLKGKLLGRPVYELLGGPQKERIFCYASNTDLSYGTEHSIAWFLELGFRAVKLFVREGPEAGIEGIRRTVDLVDRTREQIGGDVELMVDGWMSLNVEYAVRLAEALRPYQVKWLEDLLLPEDLEGYARLRQRLPNAILASGEHWYTVHPFAAAAGRGLVDILQPLANLLARRITKRLEENPLNQGQQKAGRHRGMSYRGEPRRGLALPHPRRVRAARRAGQQLPADREKRSRYSRRARSARPG